MTARVLVAEDEQTLRRALVYALERDGYAVTAVGDGEAVLGEVARGSYDLAILDIMMPGTSGLEATRRIRGESGLPIILLTARDAEADVVIGLEAGADDYVTKPFSVAELMGRVNALLRRRRLDAAESAAPRLAVTGVTVDVAGRVVEVDGREVRLTSSEFELLLLFVRAPGQVFSRRSIMEHLWRTTYFGDERAADAHIANLRRKLEDDPQQPTRILTVRGVGYKLARSDEG